MRRPRPYGWSAPLCDLVSVEWPVYRAGRITGVEALRLRPGDRVLDVGCGTGLSLPLLRAAVGPTGRVVGVDRSPDMLRQARRRLRPLTHEALATRLGAGAGHDPHGRPHRGR